MGNLKHMIKKVALILVLIFLNSKDVFSQEKYARHIISKGETITKIAQEYQVKPDDIYKLNPDSNKILKLNSVLLIPVANSKKTTENLDTTIKTTGIIHEVLVKETLYGISRLYGISVKDINQSNPTLESTGLKVGQKIIISGKTSRIAGKIDLSKPKNEIPAIQTVGVNQSNASAVVVNTEVLQSSDATILGKVIVHEVLPKETKYSLAKRYGITVAELERLNPDVIKTLPVGFKLNISNSNTSLENVSVVNKETKLGNTDTKFSESNLFSPDLASQLIQNASENIGIKYHSGGTSKAGFDCSGLMWTTFGAFDIKLPRSSFEQANIGTKIGSEEAQKGDLIFFKTNGRGQINHVGMIVEVSDDEIKFIHASVQSGVIISSTKENYYKKNFIQINRVL